MTHIFNIKKTSVRFELTDNQSAIVTITLKSGRHRKVPIVLSNASRF